MAKSVAHAPASSSSRGLAGCWALGLHIYVMCVCVCVGVPGMGGMTHALPGMGGG